MEFIAVIIAFMLGWGCLRVFLIQSDVHTIGMFAFPAGMTIWVLSVIVTLILHIPYSPWVPLSLCMVGIGILNRWVGQRPRRLEILHLVLWCGVMVLISAIAQHYDLTVLTTDTLFILSMGEQFAQHGGFHDGLKAVFASFSSYLAFVQMAAYSLNVEYFKSVLPLSASSTVLLMVWLGRRLLLHFGQNNLVVVWGLPILGAAVLVSSYPYFWGAFYMKTAPVYGLMIFVACVGAVLASVEREPRWLVITSLALLATISMRLEAGLTSLPILVAIFSIATIDINVRIRLIGPISLAFGGWYAFIIIMTFARGMFGVYELFAIGVLPGIFGVAVCTLVLSERMRTSLSMNRAVMLLPWLMVVCLSGFIVAYGLTHQETAFKSLAQYGCYLGNPSLGATFFWAAAVALVLSAPFLTDRFPGETTFVFSIVGFLLVLAAIGVLTPWKHCGTHDSTNRILAHIMPTVIFYIVIKYGCSRKPNKILI